MGIFAKLREIALTARNQNLTSPKHLKGRPPVAFDSTDMQAQSDNPPEAVLDGMRIEIGYVDASGRRTDRVISCKRIVQAEDGERLLAFCHLRRTDRMFLLSRIEDVVDHTTGQPYQSITAFLEPFLGGDGGDDGDVLKATRSLLVAIGDELRILAFMAQADHALRREEDDLVSSYMRSRAEELGHEVSAHYDHAKVMDWFRSQAPDLNVLERAVERVAARSGAQLGGLWQLAATVMESDGEVTPEELDRLHELAAAIEHAMKALQSRAHLKHSDS